MTEVVAELDLPPFPRATLLATTMPDGVPLYVRACDPLFDRPGGPYLQPAGGDWPDNDIRFALLSRAAATLSHESSPLEWRPDVLHCNDWQTGLIPAYLSSAYAGDPFYWRTATFFTIHNLAYQGHFPPTPLPKLPLRSDSHQYGIAFHAPASLIALLLTGAGLIASFFHLGRPERAWRTIAQWRTSWLAREVIVLPAFMAGGVRSHARPRGSVALPARHNDILRISPGGTVLARWGYALGAGSSAMVSCPARARGLGVLWRQVP